MTMITEPAAAPLSGHIVYLAFRAAYLSTFEVLKCELDDRPTSRNGFLEHIPLLAGCAPQVQLDCLLVTWSRLRSGDAHDLAPVEQCVCYCAAGELARLGETENRRSIGEAADGPAAPVQVDSLWLASKVRALQLTLPIRFHSLSLLRDGHLISDDVDDRGRGALKADLVEHLLAVVGRWQVSPEILSRAAGLLNDREMRELGRLLQLHPGLMNL